MTETARDAAIAKMPAALVNKLTKAEEMLSDIRTSNITEYHKLGQLLKAVDDDPDRYHGNDGTDGLSLLLAATEMHKATLRTALRFAQQYSDEDMNTLLELKNKQSGFQLCWSHIPILLSLELKADRKKYAARAVREELSPKDLHSALKQDENREGGHGRPFSIPATITKQLTAITKDLTALLKKQTTVWNGEAHSTFDAIMAAEDNDIDCDWQLQLEEAQAKFAELIDCFSKNDDDITLCIQKITEVTTAREAAARHEAAETETRLNTRVASRRVIDAEPSAEDVDDNDTAAVQPTVSRSGRRRLVTV
jgi:hypothetical protein